MKHHLAMAAAALFFTGSVQAAASPPQPASGMSADVRPAALRLKGPGPASPVPTKRAIFNGSFFDSAGREYDASGTGDFAPSGGLLSFSVTLDGRALIPPINVIDFGKMAGQGIFEDNHFDIHGVPGTKGYVLDVTGVVTSGRIQGEFRLTGNGGHGQGQFTGL